MRAPGAESLEIVEAPHGSELYQQALTLREAILRAPLGLRLSEEELADDARRRHFCATMQGAVVGSVSLKPLDKETLQLRQMAVVQDRRREGIGARLLARAEDWASAEGYRRIVLNARLGAEGFYARYGYLAEGEPFDENTVPHIRMTKRLGWKDSGTGGEKMSVEVGDKAPDFTLPADGGGTVSLKGLKGKTVVLYFYPKDDTSGCTAEACAFRDALPDLSKVKAEIVGVSRDSVASHDKFKKKFKLPFPLASDEDAKSAKTTASGWRRACMAGNIWASSGRPF
jgi:peroxiredoxin Q/BCP